MKKKLTGRALRRKAETMLKKRHVAAPPMTKAETARLIRKLRVHQLELELQNKELAQSRAETETLLRQYTDLYDLAPAAYFTLTLEGSIRRVNLTGATFLGRDRGKLIKRRFAQFVSADSRSTFHAFLEKVRVSGKKQTCELTLLTNGDELLWTHVEAVCSAESNRAECLMSVVNISELKRDAAEAQVLRDLMLNTLERVSDGFVALDKDWNYTYVNQKGAEMLNRRRPADLIGRNYWKEYPEARGTPFAIAYQRALDTQTSMTVEDYYAPWGRWFENRIYASPEGLSIFFTEVTERKKAEEALRLSEQKYSVIFNKAPFAASLSSIRDGTIVDVNDEFEAVFGYTREEVIGKTSLDLGMYADPEERMRLAAVVRESGFARNEETKLRTKSGALRDIQLNTDFVTFGNEKYALTTTKDISERKRAEESLKESQARLQSYMSNAPNVIFTIDREYKITFMNYTLQGYTLDDVLGTSIFKHISEESRETAKTSLDRAFETGERQVYVALGYGQHGQPAWYSTNVGPIRKDGKVDSLILVATDITERRLAERELRESRERLFIMFDKAPYAATLSKLPEGIIQEANEAFERAFGYTKQEITGNTSDEVGINPDQEVRARIIDLIQAKGFAHDVEMTLRTKQGESRAFNVNIDMVDIGGQKYALQTAQDITDRNRAEEALRKSEFLLKETQSIAKVGGWELDVASGKITWTDEVYRIYGVSKEYNPSDISQDMSFHTPKSLPVLKESFERALEKGQPYDLELEFQPANGEKRWVRTVGRPTMVDGKVARVVGYIIDITDRKHAEETLRESEEKFATIFKAAPGSIMLSSLPDGKTVEVNDNFPLITGYTRDEALGRTTGDLGMWADPGARDRFLSRLQSEGLVRDFEADLNHKSGGIRNGLVSGYFVTLQGKKHLLGIFYDITERKQAEEALRESEERLRLFIEYAPAALAMFDREMRYIAVSRRWMNDYGLNDGEILGRSHYDIFPEITEHWKEVHRRGLRGEVITAHEDKFVRADGSTQWLHWEVRPWHTAGGLVGGIVIFSEDITDSKLAEDEVYRSRERVRSTLREVRALSDRLQQVREEERIRISRDIHDNLGQTLTALKIDLQWIAGKFPTQDSAMNRRLGEVIGLADSLIESVQKIATELRLAILDDFGIAAALEWQGGEFSARTGTRCTFQSLEVIPNLHPAVATACFRIFQEALTNITRHAHATHVTVGLMQQGDTLRLEIQDDGAGISQDAIRNARSMGLIGMRERALALGGQLEMRGLPGKGTSISLTVPLHQPATEDTP